MDNLAAVLYGKLDLRLERHDIPLPKENEVQVQMKCCGLCCTDLHMWCQGQVAGFVIDEEHAVILGHETSGVVSAVGAAVTSLQPGDRVAMELGLPCRKCDFCKRGRYNLCKSFSAGGLCQYMCHPADFCHKLPDNVSLEAGALLEPLSVGVRAGRRAGVELGSKVLVCGAGPIGLASLLAAKAMGAAEVCITDLSSNRLELAKTMGANHILLVNSSSTSQQVAAEVTSLLGCNVDCSIETTGTAVSIAAAIYATTPGGVVSPVGLDPPDVTVPIVHAATKEIDIKGVFSYNYNDYPAAVAMVASGKADPTPMITHRFKLPEVLDAYSLMRRRETGVVKIIVEC